MKTEAKALQKLRNSLMNVCLCFISRLVYKLFPPQGRNFTFLNIPFWWGVIAHILPAFSLFFHSLLLLKKGIDWLQKVFPPFILSPHLFRCFSFPMFFLLSVSCSCKKTKVKMRNKATTFFLPSIFSHRVATKLFFSEKFSLSFFGRSRDLHFWPKTFFRASGFSSTVN